MKAFFNRKTIIIAAAAVLIAIISIVSVNVFNSPGPVTGLANVISSPFKALATAVARTFENIYSSIYRYNDLQDRYDQALSDIAVLKRSYSESADLLRENNELRELLSFRQRHADHVYEQARVTGQSNNNWSLSFTISKGYANSDTPIARGNSVISHSGVLIGQITDVGATTSTAVSVLDTTFSAGAFVGEDGERSVTAKGDFSLMSSGLLILDNFSDDLIVLPGDSVVTSGAGNVFPVGLVIGEVVEVLRHDTGVGSYATVRPMRAIDSTISNVYVITSFDITG